MQVLKIFFFGTRFWALNWLRQVEKTNTKLQVCRKKYEQLMADLPKNKILISETSQKVGLIFTY